MHARLGEGLSVFNPEVQARMVGGASPTMLARMNAMVTRQAEMIAYNNDFKMMLVLTLATIPLVLFLRKPKPGAAAVLIE
jgi:DHA2 family multidrug resistance protein